MNGRWKWLLAVSILIAFHLRAQSQSPIKKEAIPHGQSAPPGPALSPQDAIKKMKVPPGFHVELVASEPNIVNPVAMTFDEKGRIWVTESIEYPRRSAGPGKDRVKVLESTQGDGQYDKITTVIDGLNIPSGIAIGHGGVWVANSPDILFYPFKDFAKPELGKPQVVVTGFGRSDTHELPNSFTWGPDGWLYGFNGVFNPSHVKQKGKDFKFTCALFRIHPKTKEFQIFCEGTSNPWGLAFNDNGDAFVSACVIDHLWHLTETGYYHRQGGPYPPFTWKIGSIVQHKHQKAAYCGLCWFDSDAYPPEYREKLYMGNIHGNCINSDELTRDGSTYLAKPRPDFLTANDVWFMPVAQKVGPDGCMYILDWYDRYHCYQDANRDPAGIDRLHGRLYRVVYKDYKSAGKFDLTKENLNQLTKQLESSNIFFRETGQRVISQRLLERDVDEKQWEILRGLALAHSDRKTRLHLLWALIGGDVLENSSFGHFFSFLRRDKDATFRAWSIRMVAKHEYLKDPASDHSIDPSLDVQLQVAIAARHLPSNGAMQVLVSVLTHCGDDKLIPHIVWQNLHPLLEKDGDRFLALCGKVDLAKSPGLAKVLPRAIDRILDNPKGDPTAVVGFIEKLTARNQNDATAKLCLTGLTVKIQNHELAGKALAALRERFQPGLHKLMQEPNSALAIEATLLLAALKDADGIAQARRLLGNDKSAEPTRLRAFSALIAAGTGDALLADADAILARKQGSPSFRGQVLEALAGFDNPGVATLALARYSDLDPETRPKAIELLTQRPSWARSLFQEIAAKKINKDVVNVNQARRLLSSGDKKLAELVEKYWGTPRNSRNPERERIVAQMKELYRKTPGDAKAGVLVFKKLCAQCHKLHGEGVDVGPDITANGRSDFDQLLSNIFDPSLVIGAGYHAVTVQTKGGQVISGLLVEDNPQRVVLKVQGGERKTIARQDVDEQFTSKVSLMPEELEKQLSPQEIVDLLTYLSFDRAPDDPKARKIPGTPR